MGRWWVASTINLDMTKDSRRPNSAGNFLVVYLSYFIFPTLLQFLWRVSNYILCRNIWHINSRFPGTNIFYFDFRCPIKYSYSEKKSQKSKLITPNFLGRSYLLHFRIHLCWRVRGRGVQLLQYIRMLLNYFSLA